MKVIDLNVLIYAVNGDALHHAKVLPYWQRLLNGSESVGLPWIVIAGFLRVTTNPRVSATPLTANAACTVVDGWLARDVVTVPLEKPTHWKVLDGFVRASGTAANLVTDAHIAAIAATRDATLVSCDRDFRRFDGLRVENPLSTGTR